VTELIIRILRHALNFQRQDTQVIHHPRHTRRHHTEVFGTHEHTGSSRQGWQFLHGLIVPELVVAAIEIVIIQTVESLFVVPAQRLIQEIILCTDARMIGAGYFTVEDEQYVADKRIEAITDAKAVTIGTPAEMGFHLTLGVKLRFHFVSTIAQTVQIGSPHLVGMAAKECVEHTFSNVGTGKEIFAEIEAIAFNLFGSHRHCR